MQERYQVEYEKQKPDKKLRYLAHLGTVDITIEMDNGEQHTATVNPLQAAVIELFSEQREYLLLLPSLIKPWLSPRNLTLSDAGKWDTEELAQRLGNLDVTSVSLALMYWHMAGVIEPTERNVFELRDSLGETNQAPQMGKIPI